MDRFVKRLSEDEFNDQRKAKRPRLKQATISSLKGVVDLKRILALKELLECKFSTDGKKIDALKELKRGSELSVHILAETGIGRAVGPLRKSENSDISDLAKVLVTKWKSKVKEAPIAHVISKRTHLPTMLEGGGGDAEIRKKAVDLFKKNHSDQSLDVAKEIEKKIYLDNDMKINKEYKQKIRAAVFKLKREGGQGSSNGTKDVFGRANN